MLLVFLVCLLAWFVRVLEYSKCCSLDLFQFLLKIPGPLFAMKMTSPGRKGSLFLMVSGLHQLLLLSSLVLSSLAVAIP